MLGFMCWYRATPGRGCAGAAQAKSGRGGASPPQKWVGLFYVLVSGEAGPDWAGAAQAESGRGGASRDGPGRRRPSTDRGDPSLRAGKSDPFERQFKRSVLPYGRGAGVKK